MKPIGIRREDKSRWEGRTPLTPHGVARLVAEGIPVVVQPSKVRVYPEEAFKRAGARVDEDLSSCSVILGVKEVPPALFLEEKAYLFFSHTIKGQSYNMPMLRRMMDRRCHLIDYEKITDDEGRRLVHFGYYAGLSGMIETLRAVGLRLASMGQNTPLASVRSPYEYDSLADAKMAVEKAGEEIAAGNWPEALRPFVVGIAGYGNVSQGAQEILRLLRPEEAAPEDLPSLGEEDRTGSVFVQVVFEEKHMVRPIEDGAAFDLQEYYNEPEKYRSQFEDHLPHLSALVSAIYWEEKYPRLVTLDYLRRAWRAGEPRLLVIGDITCDLDGAVQCTVKTTEPGNPCYVYEPLEGRVRDGVEGEGPVVVAVDILPSELPRDASEAFTKALSPFLPDLARADFGRDLDSIGLPDPIRRALILHKGKLTEDYAYMSRFL